MEIDLVLKYFPNLSQDKINKFKALRNLFIEWNEKINLISRKEIDLLYERHILHSLSIAKVISFNNNNILDVGTGGGFPGIPLAIMFPETKFTLIDSIGKKIKVVKDISEKLNIDNITPINDRVENLNEKFDFIVSRAVTNYSKFLNLIKGKLNNKGAVLYLKGDNILEEIQSLKLKNYRIYPINDYFTEPFFTTKIIFFHKF